MKLTFREIEKGDSLPLNVSGESPRNIRFQYANPDISKIQVRQKEGVDSAVRFSNTTETVRILGEISDPTLYKVTGRNPGLDTERGIGLYPKVTGDSLPDSGRNDLNITERTFALPVIVKNMSYFGEDDKAPAEINKSNSYSRTDWRNVPEFGNGLAIGTLESNGIFTVMGFVEDARAVALK
jgi:hypothetical protein